MSCLRTYIRFMVVMDSETRNHGSQSLDRSLISGNYLDTYHFKSLEVVLYCVIFVLKYKHNHRLQESWGFGQLFSFHISGYGSLPLPSLRICLYLENDAIFEKSLLTPPVTQIRYKHSNVVFSWTSSNQCSQHKYSKIMICPSLPPLPALPCLLLEKLWVLVFE